MSRATYGIMKYILAQKGSSFAAGKQEMGLRRPAEFVVEDAVVGIEREKHVVNYKKFSSKVETVQCGYDMLKDFIEKYCVDQMVEAHIVTQPQKATPDSSPRANLKGNEVYNFTYGSDNNGYMGFKFKYVEEYANNKHEAFAEITNQVALPKAVADEIITLAKVATSTLTDTNKPQNVDPAILTAIEHPSGTALVDLTDIVSYKLELESVGEGESMYARPYIDDLSVKITLISKKAMNEDYLSITGVDENTSLTILRKISATENIAYEFEANTVSRKLGNKNSNSRSHEIVWSGKIPLFKATFSTSVAGGITTKKIIFGS